jgi:hypothetical protein
MSPGKLVVSESGAPRSDGWRIRVKLMSRTADNTHSVVYQKIQERVSQAGISPVCPTEGFHSRSSMSPVLGGVSRANCFSNIKLHRSYARFTSVVAHLRFSSSGRTKARNVAVCWMPDPGDVAFLVA